MKRVRDVLDYWEEVTSGRLSGNIVEEDDFQCWYCEILGKEFFFYSCRSRYDESNGKMFYLKFNFSMDDFHYDHLEELNNAFKQLAYDINSEYFRYSEDIPVFFSKSDFDEDVDLDGYLAFFIPYGTKNLWLGM